MIELILTVLVVLIGSALCSSTEAALFSVPIARVKKLAEEGVKSAIVLVGIKESLARPIAAIVILNNIFNIVGSIAVGSMAHSLYGEAWVAVISGVLTFLVIVCAEIIPKTLGERYSSQIAVGAARPVYVITVVLSPVIILIEAITKPMQKGANPMAVDEQEIQILARDSMAAGEIGEAEADLIQRVFGLKSKTAHDIMTPRVSVSTLDGECTIEECRELLARSQHSRLIIIGESQDDVLGVGLKSELLGELVDGRGHRQVKSLLRDVIAVPTSVSASQLLRSFQESRQHLHLVLDEYGGVAGVVTLEDVLEELTGEILDETDRVADLQEFARRRSGRRR